MDKVLIGFFIYVAVFCVVSSRAGSDVVKIAGEVNTYKPGYRKKRLNRTFI
ncbi:MAG: hypothetical protein LBU10_01310 [Endomicrobium sp.]|jgi:hypothetical protein|nr:hypothetical protein [Endomicrobium sp.]